MKTINGLMGGRAALFFAALLTLASGGASAKEFLVKYKTEPMFTMMNDPRIAVMGSHDIGKLIKIDIEEKDEKKVLVQLASDRNIEYVVPNFRIQAFAAPVDIKALKDQYAIAKVQAEKAWQLAGNKGSKNVLLAVIDTGTDYRHKNLAPNMVPGFDFIRNNNDPMDITSSANPGHGTHCTGIVGATGVVDDGIVGISPELSIMPLRFLDERGGGTLENGIRAIDYAIQNKVQVISASWGAAVSRKTAMPLIEAIERAEKAGVIFVAAASNDGKNNDSFEVYPTNAGLSNVISVAASDRNDKKPYWSNYGKRSVHLASPGDGIISTLPADKYGTLSGTSMATPLVAGLVAFIKAQDPSLSPLQLRSLLQASGDKVGIETACDCRVNAATAVEMIQNKTMVVSPHAAALKIGESKTFEAFYGEAPFSFEVSDTKVASIAQNGELKGLAAGTVTVKATDKNGKVASSYNITVDSGSSSQPPSQPSEPPSNPPADPGQCPLPDEALCDIACQLQPDLPFCSM